MANNSDMEERVKQLEYVVEKLRADLAQVRRMASQAQEDADHIEFPSSGAGELIRVQILSGGVSASTGPSLGVGFSAARFQTVIGGTRYNLTDGTAGHYTDEDVYNDTFSSIVPKTYAVCKYVNGLLTILVGTCTPAAAFSADDVTAPGFGG